MSLPELNKNRTCDKCGFIPNYQVKWKLEYVEKCREFSCGWDDKEILEHLHQECPECGYTLAVPTHDYKELVGELWTTEELEEAPKVDDKVVQTLTPTLASRSTATTVTGWDTQPCVGCPETKA